MSSQWSGASQAFADLETCKKFLTLTNQLGLGNCMNSVLTKEEELELFPIWVLRQSDSTTIRLGSYLIEFIWIFISAVYLLGLKTKKIIYFF